MDKFEHLERVNRLCHQLQLHMGVSDKDLAEYLLHLCQSKDNDRQAVLAELMDEGVELPEALLDSLLSLTSNRSITKRNPDLLPADDLRALSLPNDPRGAKELARDIYQRSDDSSRSNLRPFAKNSGRGNDRQQHDSHIAATTAAPKGYVDEGKERKRLSSPERFELKQLMASGAMDPRKHPELMAQLREEISVARLDALRGPPVEVDVELADVEPSFLKGSHRLAADLSPVRVVKNPRGTLARAAMQGAASAAERRERKQMEQRSAEREMLGEKRSELASSWNDPLGHEQPKLLASSIKTDVGDQSSFPRFRGPEELDRQDSHTHARSSSSSTAAANMTTNIRRTIREERESLPIAKLRPELMASIRDNRILLIIGETGSGKTTQITQYLAEEGYCDGGGRIGCTQPRRVAAMSVARRVAEEIGCPLGAEVGYTIRFEDCTSTATVIKYMTDGMLLRECLADPMLSSYSVIVLDEAHERTVHTDVLFGLCKQAVASRPLLRLIITSATLETSKFSDYFGGCPVFTIPGRSFPVQIVWSAEPEPDYLEAAIECILRIHRSEPPGDILVFLTGQEEIDSAVEYLQERGRRMHDNPLRLFPLPVYSALPNEQQSRIFAPAPPGFRKVVLATNIAETSLTIDGIIYVVDPGFCKLKTFSPRLGMDTLSVTPISQAQAGQRAGRAGRTGPGKCFRLYTETAFEQEMLPVAIPEIQRTNLSLTVLTLKAMGINDLVGFDFMDRPAPATLLSAMEGLFQLGALDDDGFLTRLGRRMADFPLDPPLSKCLLSSIELRCTTAILSVVAIISAGGSSLFFRPRDRQEQADQKRARFSSRDGDLLTFLRVYDAWLENGRSAHWCQENYIQHRALKRAYEIRRQLLAIVSRFCKSRDGDEGEASTRHDSVAIRRALCAGLFRQAARRDRSGEEGGYRTVLDDHPAAIHPSSVLYPARPSSAVLSAPPSFVLYSELIRTSREWLRDVTPIDPRWLVEAAPALYRHPDEGRLSKRQREERIVPLHNPHDRNEEWRLSRQAAYYRAARSR